MIPEFGHFALILALGLALIQASVPLLGAARQRADWMALARPVAVGQFVFVAAAFVVLAHAFYVDDFSVRYVALNSNTALPTPYKIAAVWGSHEGSLLLWILILAGWTLGVAAASRGLPETMAARVLGILGLVSVGMLLFTLLTSNPFDRVFPPPVDGNDLNPLLQDPGLVMHPPILYMGYVGLSVPFAFSVAALMTGRLNSAWARWTRPWTVGAWMFLTVGIALGSWWAYYELGWGGWWFWDPVENASFMPWLAATALIHSLAVTERRGIFKSWTLLLAIAAFSLSLLGTFLVRSGILVSVHAFASDPARGLFILLLLSAISGGSLLLYAVRARRFKDEGGFRPISRESFLLVNNVLLIAATAVVLLGTLYPLFSDALGFGKPSVGPPYFNIAFLIPMLPTGGVRRPGHARVLAENVRFRAGTASEGPRRRRGAARPGAALAAVRRRRDDDHYRRDGGLLADPVLPAGADHARPAKPPGARVNARATAPAARPGAVGHDPGASGRRGVHSGRDRGFQLQHRDGCRRRPRGPARSRRV